MQKPFVPFFFLTLLLLSVACNKTPGYVIPHDRMVDLLIDMHKAEGVVSAQSSRYYNDSLKKRVKQSVYLKHGVTAEQVDTSFLWYGRHLDEYVKIYDDVIARLEDEVNQTDVVVSNVMTEDSLEVWPGPRRLRLDGKFPPSGYIFEIEPDGNWLNGDNYQWEAKLINTPRNAMSPMQITFIAEYDDDVREFVHGRQSTDGFLRVRLVLDSTRVAKKISGFLTFENLPSPPMFVDSISLIRTRLNKELYQRRGHQRF